MEYLLKASKNWKKLTKLDLCNNLINFLADNNIGPKGMEYLFKASTNWPHLT